MHRIIVAVLVLAVLVIGCQSQPTPTPTSPPPPPPTTAPVVPTDTPTVTPLPPTPTNSPTLAPPTATPTPTPLTGIVSSTLNVRQLPSLNAKLLGVLSKGDTVTLLGRTTDNAWYQIYFPITQTTSTGWAISRLINTTVVTQTLPTFNTKGTPVATSAATAAATSAATLVPTLVATPTTITGGTPGSTGPVLGTPVPTKPAATATTASGTVTTTATVKPTATGTPVAGGPKASGSIIFDTFVNGQYQINRVRGDGSGLTVLFSGASEPALSPNGTVLAYHKRKGPSGAGLAIASLNGSNEQILVGAPEAGYPTWSPDGNNLAYHWTSSGEIFWIPAQPGQTPTQVVARGSFRPAWRPGGNVLLFDGCNGDGTNCYSLHKENNIFTPDPSNPALVVHGTNGAWSPNASQIAFQDADSSGATNLFVANADGSNKRQVTKDTGHSALPIWSADGQWLFYRSDQGGTAWAIYAIKLDGSNKYKIADAPVNADNWVYEKLAIAP